jgi:uncharacterized protein YegP (UPF0339 family)
MATATKKVHAARPVGPGARDVSESASLEFLVDQANGGDYRWEIVGERGESLAQSGGFASRADAERAARCVHDGAGSARFEPHVAEERQLEAV